jgi:putative addiction module component (TIGR02574 family)
MALLSKAEIAALSPQERLALIDDLWESLDEVQERNAATAPVSEWQRSILDERIDDLHARPEDEVSLTEARSQSLL